ncbi:MULTISPECIES: AAA family ATPase [unclassified Paenibacillus]|uniref:AAA family ATPase n=1 Tax=unclassified Paenibacillus TaxID=185978 RepID=UPI002F3E9E33
MGKLIFVVGGAGAGKTTIAKGLASKRKLAFFDMDTLLRPAAVAIMTLQGLDPNDRDSPEYKRLCRDLGYRITMDAALENVSIGIDAVVIGPFTKETEDAKWLEKELQMAGMTQDQVEVKVVVVHLSDEETYRSRFIARSSELDKWKLDNWKSFKASLKRREMAWPLKEGSILYFDNSLALSDDRLAMLEQFVFGAKT